MRCCLISQDDMIISKYAEDGTTGVRIVRIFYTVLKREDIHLKKSARRLIFACLRSSLASLQYCS